MQGTTAESWWKDIHYDDLKFKHALPGFPFSLGVICRFMSRKILLCVLAALFFVLGIFMIRESQVSFRNMKKVEARVLGLKWHYSPGGRTPHYSLYFELDGQSKYFSIHYPTDPDAELDSTWRKVILGHTYLFYVNPLSSDDTEISRIEDRGSVIFVKSGGRDLIFGVFISFFSMIGFFMSLYTKRS